MIWNDHHKLEGLHAFLGASTYHWLGWSDETLAVRFASKYSTEIGTAIHQLASDCIKSHMKLNENDKHLVEYTLFKIGIPRSVYDSEKILMNLIPFVNDAIGFHMDSEVILYYSPFCFGTTDAIGYDKVTKTLRISDYKSGTTPAHMEQLMIYAALFCLEYYVDPKKDLKKIELRIYQNNDIAYCEPTADDILHIMNLIKTKSALATNLYERDSK